MLMQDQGSTDSEASAHVILNSLSTQLIILSVVEQMRVNDRREKEAAEMKQTRKEEREHKRFEE